MLPKSVDKSTASLKQVYRIASVARRKLGAAADQPEHNLRLLVAHANLLDDLSETLLNSPSEDKSTKSDRWADVLSDLDQDSEESDCSEDSDPDPSVEEDIHGRDISLPQRDVQNKPDRPKADFPRPAPRTPAALVPAIIDAPELKRMKRVTILESIHEGDLIGESNATLQTMEVVPAALHTLQTIQTLQRAEIDAIIRITEIEVFAEAEPSFDIASTRLSTPSIVVDATSLIGKW